MTLCKAGNGRMAMDAMDVSGMAQKGTEGWF